MFPRNTPRSGCIPAAIFQLPPSPSLTPLLEATEQWFLLLAHHQGSSGSTLTRMGACHVPSLICPLISQSQTVPSFRSFRGLNGNGWELFPAPSGSQAWLSSSIVRTWLKPTACGKASLTLAWTVPGPGRHSATQAYTVLPWCQPQRALW